MTDDYTPTTEDVRGPYIVAGARYAGQAENRRREFDRWLAEHDREVAATERERCAQVADATADNWAMTYKQFAATEIAAAIREVHS